MVIDPRTLRELSIRTALEAIERLLARRGPAPPPFPEIAATLANGARHAGTVLALSLAGRRIVLETRGANRGRPVVLFDPLAIVSLELSDLDAAPEFAAALANGDPARTVAPSPRTPNGVVMGLEEKRALKKFQEETYPAFKKRIDEAAGMPVAMEVVWETLAANGYAHLLEEALGKVYFEPLRAALAEVARDELGREALKGGLRKVIVRNASGHTNGNGFTFQNGELTIDHEPVTNIDSGDERRVAIVKLLNEGL